jgi:hypothetical protein
VNVNINVDCDITREAVLLMGTGKMIPVYSLHKPFTLGQGELESRY